MTVYLKNLWNTQVMIWIFKITVTASFNGESDRSNYSYRGYSDNDVSSETVTAVTETVTAVTE